MTQNESEQGMNGIADIISNLLGILIVVILLTALAAGSVEKSADRKDKEQNNTFEFKTSRREWFPPWSEFFIVAFDRIVKWDMDRTIQWFSEAHHAPGAAQPYKIQNEMGVFLLDDIHYQRDIDTYLMRFQIDWGWWKNSNEPMDEPRMTAFIEERRLRARKARVAPAFFVYPSGMKLFARLHGEMGEHRIPFRWDTVGPGKPIYLYRDRDQFNADDFYFN